MNYQDIEKLASLKESNNLEFTKRKSERKVAFPLAPILLLIFLFLQLFLVFLEE